LYKRRVLKIFKQMKRVTYKKEFKSIEDALTKIPNQLKENDEVFEITDGNKTIQVRWEGTLEEGAPIALAETDSSLISEDISKMKNLMGYTSEKTIGTPTANNRVSENKTFKDLLSSSKKKILNESISIDEITQLHEIEILDEGLISKLGKIAVMVGISLSSFMAMAQESPQKAVEAIKEKASQMTPEQVEHIRKVTGIAFSPEVANDMFYFNGASEPAPDLELGGYADIKGAKVVKQQRVDGKLKYIVQVNQFYSNPNNFSNVRSYIEKHNKGNESLKDATIEFINSDGSPFVGRGISLN
tara:strand:+ start:1808 stop:2710 length:903 start_codon:yes stop_codon:yes gene_type:complete